MSVEPELIAAREPLLIRRLPYAFAKRHGVLVLDEREGGMGIACRPGVSARSLAELRRHLHAPLRPFTVPADRFERLLQDAYEGDSDGAQRMMETSATILISIRLRSVCPNRKICWKARMMRRLFG